MVVQPLVRRGFVERAETLDVGADLHEVEGVVDFLLHLLPARIQGQFQPGVVFSYMPGEGQQGPGVAALSQKQEAVDAEVVVDEPVGLLGSELPAEVQLQERRVAPGAGPSWRRSGARPPPGGVRRRMTPS